MSLGSENAGEQPGGREDDRDGEDRAAVAFDERGERSFADADGGAVGQALLALDDDRVAGLQPAGDLGELRRRQPERRPSRLCALLSAPATMTKRVVVLVEDRVDRHGERVPVLLGDDLDAHRRADGESRPRVERDAHVGRHAVGSTAAGRVRTLPASASSPPGTRMRTALADLDARADRRSPPRRRPAAATDRRRAGSHRRRTPRPCRRDCARACATTPAKRARTTVRDCEHGRRSATAALAPARARRVASASSRLASSSSFCAATPCSTSVVSRVDRRLRVLHARLRLLDLGAPRRDVGGQRGNLEADQQIAGLDAIPFGLWQLDDARRLRRRDRPVGAGRRRHGAGGADDALRSSAGPPSSRRRWRRRSSRPPRPDGCRSRRSAQRRQAMRQQGREPHCSAVPMARSRSASAS